MLWRLIDPQHPEFDASLAAEYGAALPEFYQQIDQVLGEVLKRADDHTTVIVLSDHGFAPYKRSFNLNTWLLNHGYITLKSEPNPDQSQAFANVDWSRTRAYGLGLNGLYLNLHGREREGVVEPGAQADVMLKQIKDELLSAHDPKNNLAAITRVDLASNIYQGPYAQQGPDLIVGYNRGYRAGWQTILGNFPADIFRQLQSMERRSLHGLHVGAGSVADNWPIAASSPALTDIAPTIFAEFGIEKPAV